MNTLTMAPVAAAPVAAARLAMALVAGSLVAAHRCSLMKLRTAENTSSFHISKNADLMQLMLSLQIIRRPEPTLKMKDSANARPLTFGAVSMTRSNHSSETRPVTSLDDLRACSRALSSAILFFARQRQDLALALRGWHCRLPPVASLRLQATILY